MPAWRGAQSSRARSQARSLVGAQAQVQGDRRGLALVQGHQPRQQLQHQAGRLQLSRSRHPAAAARAARHALAEAAPARWQLLSQLCILQVRTEQGYNCTRMAQGLLK